MGPVTSLSRQLIGQDVGLTSRNYLLIGRENTLCTLGVLICSNDRIRISVPVVHLTTYTFMVMVEINLIDVLFVVESGDLTTSPGLISIMGLGDPIQNHDISHNIWAVVSVLGTKEGQMPPPPSLF